MTTDEDYLGEVKHKIRVLCPHCNKKCDISFFMNTDDEGINTAFELLAGFEMKGEKVDG